MTKDEIKTVATHILSHTSKMMEHMKFYNECADTDCRTCELGEVCKKTVELEEKWEAKK